MRFPFIHPIIALCAILAASSVAAQCPEQPPLKYYTGAGSVVCPCFVAGEEAGVVFTAPAEMPGQG